jgi:hypothetical protein
MRTSTSSERNDLSLLDDLHRFIPPDVPPATDGIDVPSRSTLSARHLDAIAVVVVITFEWFGALGSL